MRVSTTARSVAFILYFVALSQTAAEEWVYANPIEPTRYYTIETNPDSFGVRDVRDEAKFCAAESADICIKSRDFELHIPKRLSSPTDTWTRSGVTYTATVMKHPWRFLGVEDKTVYEIEKPNPSGKGTLRFLYSSSRGLIGMGGFTDTTSGVFLLQSKCGFGAPSSCSNTAK